MKLFYFMFFVLMQTNLLAKNDKDNGGDNCEQRFVEIKNDLKDWIDRGGPENLELPSDVQLRDYKGKMLNYISSADFQCTTKDIIVNGTSKTCKNEVVWKKPKITCNYNRFMNSDIDGLEDKQYLLIHHEFAGLSRFETNNGNPTSDYRISNQISAFLDNVQVKKLAVRPASPTPPNPNKTKYNQKFPSKDRATIVRNPGFFFVDQWYPICEDSGHGAYGACKINEPEDKISRGGSVARISSEYKECISLYNKGNFKEFKSNSLVILDAVCHYQGRTRNHH